jgi:hypothetical protein
LALEGALYEFALLNIFLKCWSNGVLEYWKNENPKPIDGGEIKLIEYHKSSILNLKFRLVRLGRET